MKTTYPEKKKIAIIGCGGWAEKICLYLTQNKNFDVVGIICKNISKFKKFKKQQIFNNVEELLSARKVDGLYIAGNPEINLQMVKDIIKHSSQIPIILEKPISIKIEDAQEIFNICRKTKLKMIINQSNLYDPLYVYSKKIIKAKGNIKNIKIIEGGYGPFRENINPILDWGIHSVCTYIDLTNLNAKLKNKKTLRINQEGGLVKKIYLGSELNIDGTIITGNLLKNKTRLFKISFKDNNDIITIDLVKREIKLNNNIITPLIKLKNQTSFDNLFENFYKEITHQNKKIFNNKNFKISLQSQKIINEII